jgi:hypothetical protein
MTQDTRRRRPGEAKAGPDCGPTGAAERAGREAGAGP